MGKHSVDRRSPLPIILGIVAAVAIAGVAFLVFRMLSGSAGASTTGTAPTASTTTTSPVPSPSPSPSSSPSTAAPSTTSASPTESTAEVVARKALQECVARQDAAKPVVAAVTTGAQHWADHVQGQRDIDSGARPLIQVKTETWGPTRAAGPGDVSTFQSAMASYSGVGGCQDVGALSASPDLTPKLQACAAHEKALDAYMEAGESVMGDWQTHLSEMADRADGHVNSVQAQENWLKRYREAPAHLDPYKAAADALAAAPACTTA